MGLFGKGKKPEVSRKQSLDAVVIASQGISIVRADEGLITLQVPFQAPPFVAKLTRFLGGSHHGGTRDIQLDEVGSFCWNFFDGKTTVREMIHRLSDRYKINRKEAEVSLTTFIRTLGKKRLVFLAVPKSRK